MSVPQSPYTLVVCEKPDAARRIAHALETSNLKEISIGASLVFSITNRFVVCYAVGHLYGLVDVNGNRSVYPVFDIKWAPTATRSKHI